VQVLEGILAVAAFVALMNLISKATHRIVFGQWKAVPQNPNFAKRGLHVAIGIGVAWILAMMAVGAVMSLDAALTAGVATIFFVFAAMWGCSTDYGKPM